MMYDNASDFWDGMEDLHEFSFFRKPIQNTEPYRAITVVDVYRYVVGHYAKQQTETLRTMPSSSEAKKFKATHFDYCTFSGLFRRRNEKELLQHSGLMCLDFDHVGNPDKLKEQLLKHEYFDTELMFTSPSGDGVKWIIPIELKGWNMPVSSRRWQIASSQQACLLWITLEATWLVHVSFPMTHRLILIQNMKNMSKKTFSAQEWENVPSKQEPAYSAVMSLNETTTDLHVEVERVVADIEARGIDIAPQYDTWVNIGFALSEGLGEGGRDFSIV